MLSHQETVFSVASKDFTCRAANSESDSERQVHLPRILDGIIGENESIANAIER
jgi:hypothetical protein